MIPGRMLCPKKSRFAISATLTRIFPALRLVGAIRQAFDLRTLVIAALGPGTASAGLVALLDRLDSSRSADTTPDLFVPSITSKKPIRAPSFWSWQTVSTTSFPAHGASPAFGGAPVRLSSTPGAGWASDDARAIERDHG